MGTVEDSVDTVGREAKADTTPPMMVAKVEEAAFRWLVETVDSVDTVDGGKQRRRAFRTMVAKVEEAAFRCLVEMLEQKTKKKKMACTVIMGETMVRREAKEARVATMEGDYSFYSEVQGIVALFGGSDYLGDADEVVGFKG